MSFIHADFLLQSEPARQLYHEYAASEPILDYHNHLPPQDIAQNRQFGNLFEIWLAGDHYKWRAMRADGASEAFCTGEAPPYEKFLAWARTVPHTLRNPLYHWTHLELKRYFDIDDLLSEATAPAIWEHANEHLSQPEFSTQGILARFGVRALCTTDDPADSLEDHKAIASSGCATRVYPTFRPDKAWQAYSPDKFNAWVSKLAATCGGEIGTFEDYLSALRARHTDFHEVGCRLSDHGLWRCYAQFPSVSEAAAIFDRTRAGEHSTREEGDLFAAYMLRFFAQLDFERGWTKQLHIGALRNANARREIDLGPDTGFDTIGDWPQARMLAGFLSHLEYEGILPRTVIYNVNPTDNMTFATMIGNFQDGVTPGKIQFGSAWWFLDTKQGIEDQINALSNAGLLWRFIGMLTDSRSFMSFSRHEYFRRVLCNLLGEDIERGELPRDLSLIGEMVRGICYSNAEQYLGLGKETT